MQPEGPGKKPGMEMGESAGMQLEDRHFSHKQGEGNRLQRLGDNMVAGLRVGGRLSMRAMALREWGEVRSDQFRKW